MLVWRVVKGLPGLGLGLAILAFHAFPTLAETKRNPRLHQGAAPAHDTAATPSGSGDQPCRGYTSVGAGSSIVPVRFNCPPEITLHRLRRHKLDFAPCDDDEVAFCVPTKSFWLFAVPDKHKRLGGIITPRAASAPSSSTAPTSRSGRMKAFHFRSTADRIGSVLTEAFRTISIEAPRD